MTDVQTRILELVERQFGRRPGLEEPLTSLGVDSLELADFVGVVEKEFRIDVDADIMDVETLAELVHYVEARR